MRSVGTTIIVTVLVCMLAAIGCDKGSGQGEGPEKPASSPPRRTGPMVIGSKGLAELPPLPGQRRQSGLGGAFVGVSGGALIVAGGANFPESLPWRGGKKVWHDEIFIMVKEGRGDRWVRINDFTLPRALAYGAAVTTEGGIICIGGSDADTCYAECFELIWDGGTVRTKELPSLPTALSFMAAATVKDVIYVVGGQETRRPGLPTKNVFSLDLSRRGREDFAWKVLAPWPGPTRVMPIAAGQSDGHRDCLYLFGGRHVTSSKEKRPLRDGYKYTPDAEEGKRWTRLGDLPACVMAAAAIDSGASHILVFGGNDGRLALDVRRYVKAGRVKEITQLYENHPGYRQDILRYDTIEDTWSTAGTLIKGLCSTTAVHWDGGIVIPSGETHPGVRTAQILKVKIGQKTLPPPPAAGASGKSAGSLLKRFASVRIANCQRSMEGMSMTEATELGSDYRKANVKTLADAVAWVKTDRRRMPILAILAEPSPRTAILSTAGPRPSRTEQGDIQVMHGAVSRKVHVEWLCYGDIAFGIDPEDNCRAIRIRSVP